MALTNNEKQAALRKRRAAIGLKRIEFWVTDTERARLNALYNAILKTRGSN